MISTDELINERKKEYAKMKKTKDPSILLDSDFPENRKYKHMLYWPSSVCMLNVYSWIRAQVRVIYKDIWTGEIQNKQTNKQNTALKEAFHRGRVRTDHDFKVLNEFEVIKQYRKHERGGVCLLRVAHKFVFEHAEFGNSKKI